MPDQKPTLEYGREDRRTRSIVGNVVIEIAKWILFVWFIATAVMLVFYAIGYVH